MPQYRDRYNNLSEFGDALPWSHLVFSIPILQLPNDLLILILFSGFSLFLENEYNNGLKWHCLTAEIEDKQMYWHSGTLAHLLRLVSINRASRVWSIMSLPPRVSDSGSRWGQGTCTSIEFPVMLMWPMWGPHFENHCTGDTQLYRTGPADLFGDPGPC